MQVGIKLSVESTVGEISLYMHNKSHGLAPYSIPVRVWMSNNVVNHIEAMG